MDYSLLMSVHNLDQAARENVRFLPFASIYLEYSCMLLSFRKTWTQDRYIFV